MLHALAAVARGEDESAGDGADLRPRLEEHLEMLRDRGVLIRPAVLRIWDGERDPDALTMGLDNIDATLIRRLLELTTEE